MWFIVIALSATFLLSRSFLFVLQKACGKKMYITANVLSLLTSAALFAFAGTDNLVTGFIQGLVANGIIQFFWLAVDFAKFNRETKQS